MQLGRVCVLMLPSVLLQGDGDSSNSSAAALIHIPRHRKAMRQFCQGLQCGQALQLLEGMRLEGNVPDLAMWNTLITAGSHDKQPAWAIEVYQAMQRQGLVPNFITYNNVIKECNDAERPELAAELLKNMQQPGVLRSKGEYACLIYLMKSTNQSERLLEVLQTMHVHGVAPDLKIYNSIMSTYEKANQPEHVFQAFSAMTRQGVVPNEFTYSAVVQVLRRQGPIRCTSDVYEAYTRLLDDLCFCSIGARPYFTKMSRNLACFSVQEMSGKCVYNAVASSGDDGSWQDAEFDPLKSKKVPSKRKQNGRNAVVDRRIDAEFKLLNDFCKSVCDPHDCKSWPLTAILWSLHPLCASCASAVKQLQERLPCLELKVVVENMVDDPALKKMLRSLPEAEPPRGCPPQSLLSSQRQLDLRSMRDLPDLFGFSPCISIAIVASFGLFAVIRRRGNASLFQLRGRSCRQVARQLHYSAPLGMS